MLKRLLSIILIMVVISAHFSRLFVFAGFRLNQDYIAKELCINKNKPQLHCEGKCFLMKKLAEAEKKQQTQERNVQKNLFQEVATINNQVLIFHTALIAVLKEAPQTFYSFDRDFSIFHPPANA